MTDGKMIPKGDDYANVMTGLSGPPDKSSYTFYGKYPRLHWVELESMYEQEPLAARIVDRLVDDAVREGFEFTGEDIEYDWSPLMSDLENLDALTSMANAWRWARLHGGALAILAVNDGRPFDQPLDLSTARGLAGISVVESTYAQPDGYDAGLGSRAFSNPERYLITLPFGSGKQRVVHRSRVIRFDGLLVTNTRRFQYNGWGPSVLQRTWTALSQLGEVMGYARAIMHDISVMVLKMKDFRAALCGEEDSQAQIKQVLENIRLTVDNLHVLGLDAEDSYEEVKRDITGLEKLIEKFVDAAVRATNYPRVVLLGEQPGGINANADSEIRGYYDWVHSEQRMYFTPRLNRLIQVMLAIRQNRGEVVPKEWQFTYRQLWQPTEQDKADTRLKNAQADQIYIVTNVLTPAQVAERLVGEGFIDEAQAPGQAGTVGFSVEGEMLALTDPPEPPSNEPVPPDLVQVQEAAKTIGVPTRTLTLMMERGLIRYWQFGSRRQVSLSEVMESGKVDQALRDAVDPEVLDEVFGKYKETVNMSASELERWSDTECSKLASDSRAPITRNLRLLRKNKDEWDARDVRDANKTIAFVARMKNGEQGEPAKDGCPSRRDISLKNWAFDPNK